MVSQSNNQEWQALELFEGEAGWDIQFSEHDAEDGPTRVATGMKEDDAALAAAAPAMSRLIPDIYEALRDHPLARNIIKGLIAQAESRSASLANISMLTKMV